MIAELTDLELLGLAAKAAGIECRPANHKLAGGLVLASHPSGFPTVWNPLADDGDALRLAVKLDLDIYFSDTLVKALAHGTPVVVVHDSALDKPTTTRRAIVRAAAEIGRSMS